MLAPLHLRLANVRRFLNKYLPDGGDFNNDLLYVRLLTMIRTQRLPVCIRVDSQNEYEAVLVERVIGDDVNLYDKENTKDFYVLACGFKTEQQCQDWIMRTVEYMLPWTLGRHEKMSTIC